MDHTLWGNILSFDFDHPISEYGFSTRLELENGWTTNFAKGAIIEYKKFMYLAASSDAMVSPSEIVDIVWHQHLIFSQSYDAFCTILGKKIAHIPSTHHKADFAKFKLAKEKTQILYTECFGEQPKEFWEFSNIYEPLKLGKSIFTVWKLLSIGLFLWIPGFFLGYFLIKPFYIHIHNPDFVIGYALIIFFSFMGLEFYNQRKLNEMMSRFDKSAFLFNLSALELVYLRKGKISDVIHGVVNNLIKEGTVFVTGEQKLTAKHISKFHSVSEYCVVETIGEKHMDYTTLLNLLVSKPAFQKTVNAMDTFKKYLSRSRYFIRLFALNFLVTAILLLIGAIRIGTGVTRDKPIVIITVVTIAYLFFAIWFLYRLKIMTASVVLPKFYRKHFLPEKSIGDNWEWNYFLFGSSIFITSFVPLMTPAEREWTGDATSGSCSSSGCASSCGGDGGCGGCGGD